MTKSLAEQAENLAVKRSTPNKLTKADLEAIRGLYEDPNRISVEAIGRLFGVSKVAVYKRALTLGWKQRTDDQARELGETILAAVHAKWQSIGVDENLNDNLGPNVDASRSPSSGAEKPLHSKIADFVHPTVQRAAIRRLRGIAESRQVYRSAPTGAADGQSIACPVTKWPRGWPAFATDRQR